MESLQVRDLMTKQVVSVEAEEDLATLHDLMFDYHIRHIPVVDSENELVGLVSHRDLVGVALYSGNPLPVSAIQELLRCTKVREIMMSEVETVSPEEDLREAGLIMLENKYSCLPVTERGKLIGILTEADFVRKIVEEQRPYQYSSAIGIACQI